MRCAGKCLALFSPFLISSVSMVTMCDAGANDLRPVEVTSRFFATAGNTYARRKGESVNKRVLGKLIDSYREKCLCCVRITWLHTEFTVLNNNGRTFLVWIINYVWLQWNPWILNSAVSASSFVRIYEKTNNRITI